MEYRNSLYLKTLDEVMELKKQLKIQQKGLYQLLGLGIIGFNDYIPYLQKNIKEKERLLETLRKKERLLDNCQMTLDKYM